MSAPLDPSWLPYDPARPGNLPRVYGATPTFLGVPRLESPADYAGRDVIFLGVPYEGACTWGGHSGCELAVKTVREASARYGTYLPEHDHDFGPSLGLGDAGDVSVHNGDPAATMAAIGAATRAVLSAGARPFVFGGDHSYSPAIIAALCDQVDGPVGVIHLDSHLDNLPQFGGDPLARCGPLYRVYQLPGVRRESIVHLGIRGPRNAPAQTRLAREAGATVITGLDIRRRGLGAVIDQTLELAHQGTKAVYLTICSDILDGLANPGGPADFAGLLPADLFDLVHAVARAGLAGMDFVEIYPPSDPQNRSSHLAAWTLIQGLCGLSMGGVGR